MGLGLTRIVKSEECISMMFVAVNRQDLNYKLSGLEVVHDILPIGIPRPMRSTVTDVALFHGFHRCDRCSTSLQSAEPCDLPLVFAILYAL
jgi:hypothetical protein